jgi:hypothetical protein
MAIPVLQPDQSKIKNGGSMPDLNRWTIGKAKEWYARQPWLVGCNFVPSTAVNQLEMWQAETFDPRTISRELGWAAGLGFNSVRVCLHELLWATDAPGFKDRINRYLEIASHHGLRTMFVLFDDAWNTDPKPGKQPDPLPGIHNSGWVQSPGIKLVKDISSWPRLEAYIHGVVSAFGKDERVLLWDMYNEPGTQELSAETLLLLHSAFQWAREAQAEQPLTVCVYNDNEPLIRFLTAESDVISFHNYQDVDGLRAQIKSLKAFDRPLLCSEYMGRLLGSFFNTHLPVFKEEHVACFNWGLVSGKINTIYNYGVAGGTAEPEVWLHDIMRKDGTPFDPAEVAFIRQITSK